MNMSETISGARRQVGGVSTTEPPLSTWTSASVLSAAAVDEVGSEMLGFMLVAFVNQRWALFSIGL